MINSLPPDLLQLRRGRADQELLSRSPREMDRVDLPDQLQQTSN
jgi:hypothetical protein